MVKAEYLSTLFMCDIKIVIRDLSLFVIILKLSLKLYNPSPT